MRRSGACHAGLWHSSPPLSSVRRQGEGRLWRAVARNAFSPDTPPRTRSGRSAHGHLNQEEVGALEHDLRATRDGLLPTQTRAMRGASPDSRPGRSPGGHAPQPTRPPCCWRCARPPRPLHLLPGRPLTGAVPRAPAGGTRRNGAQGCSPFVTRNRACRTPVVDHLPGNLSRHPGARLPGVFPTVETDVGIGIRCNRALEAASSPAGSTRQGAEDGDKRWPCCRRVPVTSR